MTTTPEEVRAALCVPLRQVPGVATAHEYEPENLGELPATTLLYSNIEPRETATGPRLDVTWTWALRIYVGLDDWAESQKSMESIAFAVLSIWRDDPTLGDLLEWWTITDTGEPPDFNTERRWMRKSLAVNAIIEHVP